jgi:hypothetical protein
MPVFRLLLVALLGTVMAPLTTHAQSKAESRHMELAGSVPLD